MAAVDVKLVLLGHKNVGKTAIFNRYVYDEFGKTSMTIGAYFGMKQMKVADRLVNLAIWDTAGEEKFDALTSFYCRDAACAVICYDITQYDTFQNLSRWVDKVNNEADRNCSIIIVGNKLDLVESNPALRRVELGEAKRYAATINANVLEVSARSGANVSDAFIGVTTTCVERALKSGRDVGPSKDAKKLTRLQPPKAKEKQGCC